MEVSFMGLGFGMLPCQGSMWLIDSGGYTNNKNKKNTQTHKVLLHKTFGVQLWLLLVLLNRDGL